LALSAGAASATMHWAPSGRARPCKGGGEGCATGTGVLKGQQRKAGAAPVRTLDETWRRAPRWPSRLQASHQCFICCTSFGVPSKLQRPTSPPTNRPTNNQPTNQRTNPPTT
jgi:hypothetical protein